mmetsp:Transcript_133025/g.331965  ORF Transcript_133025/g.331965 Transcript_133025/m.331965 type:complete len:255 (-) Transcript_133025:759-1523(-)
MNSKPPSSRRSKLTSLGVAKGRNLNTTPAGVFRNSTGVFTPNRIVAFPSPKNSSAHCCAKIAARRASATSIRMTSGPTKGATNSGHATDPSPSEPTMANPTSTDWDMASNNAVATTSGEVVAAATSFSTSAAEAKQRIGSSGAAAEGGSPARTMMLRRGFFAVRLRAVEVSSSSSLAKASPRFGWPNPNNAPRSKPPSLVARASMRLRRMTLDNRSGDAANNVFKAPISTSEASSGQITATLHSDKASENDERG